MKSIRWNNLNRKNPDWRSIFSDKRVWISLTAILLIGIGGFVAYRILGTSSTEISETPQVQTVVARRGDLTVFATGVGQVIPAKEVNLGFDESGTLSELLVKVGDQVQVGQVLARLKTNQSAGTPPPKDISGRKIIPQGAAGSAYFAVRLVWRELSQSVAGAVSIWVVSA